MRINTFTDKKNRQSESVVASVVVDFLVALVLTVRSYHTLVVEDNFIPRVGQVQGDGACHGLRPGYLL